MVMPLINEDRPKCYACSADFKGLEELREHQKKEHGAAEDGGQERGPAPGDVTVF